MLFAIEGSASILTDCDSRWKLTAARHYTFTAHERQDAVVICNDEAELMVSSL